ncbi:ATP-binding cassette sub-family C member 4-like [Phymastichus coffea]|uniref:ATP-binding cassette sub-family C member 4-like n=1 Tax=Phymastichus coffea TaxID=108790 RepID=UPI00273B685D|nr:ATP-binding cassette sub-family C member 4-like [Phymastichus coffea]
MDNRKIISNPNPRERANVLSILTWTWTFNLFKKGYSKILGVEDLYDPVSTDKSSVLGDRLEKQWFAELQKAKRKNRRPSFLWAICIAFASEYFILGCIQILNELVLRLGTPMLLGALLQYFKPGSTTSYEEAMYFATSIVLASLANVISLNQTIFGAFHVGGRIRVAACSVVYRKALRLSKTAMGETAPGKIVNLVASDVNRFDIISVFIHHMWSAPLSAMVILVLLYLKIGWSALVGMTIIFLVVPFQGYLGKLSSKFRLQTSIKTDERVRLMDEIISGVQVIKMYAWEKPFCALVESARRLELKVVRKSSYIRGIYMTFNMFTTRAALFGTLITMMIRGQPLTVDEVFVYMSYFNLMAQTMSSMFVRGIAEIAECRVAVNRLQNFLMFEEFESSNVNNGIANLSNSNNSVSMNSTSKPDLPYIDEDVTYEERSNDKSRQSFVMRASELLKHDNIEANGKQKKNVKQYTDKSKENWAIRLNHVTAKWDFHSTETTLEDVNLEMERGKLYIVIGMVGAGKSSLISTILGELKVLQGNTEVKGSISYADQDAWVFGATVRQNIIFGQKFDRHRYQKVVKVCALQKDFKQFPHGDQTIVGERGSSLSGGQKARINLARSVYREADVYLLDDPLSAVDAHVGKHLFEECLQKYLSGKTRVLATHQLQYIKGANAIILLDQGKLHHFADYQELLRVHPEYNSLIAEEKAAESTEESSIEKSSHIRRQFSSSSTRSRATDSGAETDGEDEDDENNVQGDFLEGTSRGAVKGSLMIRYMRSGGSSIFALVVFILFLATQFCVSCNDWYIPQIVNAEESRNYYNAMHTVNFTDSFAMKDIPEAGNNHSTKAYLAEDNLESKEYYMYIYTAIVMSIFLVGIVRSFAFYQVCLSASQRLHDLVFGALIRATMRFFDTNPSGRILNRFSKDLGAIDELLPKATLDAGQIILAMWGSLIVTCTANKYFVIPIVVIGGIFYFIRKVYLKTSKNVKRLEGITRSPVFTHLNATLNGITTIRAYQAEKILKTEFDKLQDMHTSSWYMFIATSTAFGFSLDVFCFLFTGLVTFSFLVMKDNFTGGDVGLAITQVMSLTGMIQWGMRQSAEVTNQLMSVERVLEYSELPAEPNLRDGGELAKKKKKKLKKGEQEKMQLIEPPKDWPTYGRVEFKSVYMRYSEDEPPVLKGLTMSIRPSEKVGIVGRTGAGKSSLISALFRLAKVEGGIEIDGIDTGTIALEDLRKNISIIPQDPVLFSGTLRRNLDPFNEFTDKLLWEVLEEVELKDAVTLTGNGLDHRVLDRGSNYSTGQRQLICLARAILRNNRVLMLDEATANVDPHTDALIQRTIRTKFAPCTVLTVAHRLNTIMDSDKVLVMDKGRLVEFDHPHILLQNHHGPFSSLVKETGRAMFEQLWKVARDDYVTKHGDSV